MQQEGLGSACDLHNTQSHHTRRTSQNTSKSTDDAFRAPPPSKHAHLPTHSNDSSISPSLYGRTSAHTFHAVPMDFWDPAFRVDEATLHERFLRMHDIVESTEINHPGYWQTPNGRLQLRIHAIQGITDGNLPAVQYLCGERFVPPMLDDPDARGKTSIQPQAIQCVVLPSHFLPNGQSVEQRMASHMLDYSIALICPSPPSSLSPLIPPLQSLTAIAVTVGMLKDNEEGPWLPLPVAARLCREDICMYLLTLTGPEEDLGGRWLDGNTMCHYAAKREKMSFLKDLVDRGVDFDVRNDHGYNPLGFAIRECRMAAVRFLLELYLARGRTQQDVLRQLIERPPQTDCGKPQPLTGEILRQQCDRTVSEEAKRSLMAFSFKRRGRTSSGPRRPYCLAKWRMVIELPCYHCT